MVIADKSPKKKGRKVTADATVGGGNGSSGTSDDPITALKNTVCKLFSDADDDQEFLLAALTLFEGQSGATATKSTLTPILSRAVLDIFIETDGNKGETYGAEQPARRRTVAVAAQKVSIGCSLPADRLNPYP
jgi:hypothetical protein